MLDAPMVNQWHPYDFLLHLALVLFVLSTMSLLHINTLHNAHFISPCLFSVYVVGGKQ